MRFKFLKGFTLAEVLITLGVIGVVAAMTIPTVMTAYQKHMVETRLKHVYSTILQSFKMIQAQYGDVAFNVDDSWSYDNSKQVFEEFFAPVLVGVTAIPKSQRYYAYSPNGNKFSTDNQAVWYSLANGTVIGFAKPGEKVMALEVPSGGHISHADVSAAGIRGLKTVFHPLDKF